MVSAFLASEWQQFFIPRKKTPNNGFSCLNVSKKVFDFI